MFQLYKNRNFNEIISDTFNFFKIHGKNYFSNYIAINGGILLVLIVLLYFFFKVFYDGLFSNGNPNTGSYVENYLADNVGVFIGYGALAFVLILILTFVNNLFPIAYLKLVETNQETNLKNILNYIKSKIGKSLAFFFLSLVVLFPLIIILMALCIALCFVIIGIPLLFIVIPAIFISIYFSYYNYITTNDGYFDSLAKGYKLFIKKPWPLIGSTFIITMIVNTLVSIVTLIPYFAGIFSLMFNIESQNRENIQDGITFAIIMFGLTFVLSIILNYLLQNIISVNQGIMYYSMINETENKSVISEIDQIGIYEE